MVRHLKSGNGDLSHWNTNENKGRFKLSETNNDRKFFLKFNFIRAHDSKYHLFGVDQDKT